MITFFYKGDDMPKRKDTRTKIPILRQHLRGNLGRRELHDDLQRWISEKNLQPTEQIGKLNTT